MFFNSPRLGTLDQLAPTAHAQVVPRNMAAPPDYKEPPLRHCSSHEVVLLVPEPSPLHTGIPWLCAVRENGHGCRAHGKFGDELATAVDVPVITQLVSKQSPSPVGASVQLRGEILSLSTEQVGDAASECVIAVRVSGRVGRISVVRMTSASPLPVFIFSLATFGRLP